jgi:hypothetical protein
VRRRLQLVTVLALLATSSAVRAQEPALDAPPAAAPYSWPFRARPLAPTSFVRLDNGLSTFRPEGAPRYGYAAARLLTVAIAIGENVVPFVRGGLSFARDPAGAEGTIFANVEVGSTFVWQLAPELRAGGHLAVVLPVGSGQEGAPPFEQRARLEGGRARMGVDAPIFLTENLGIALAGSVAWVHGGLTVQGELGVEPSIRTAGSGSDGALAVLGSVHAGYFVVPMWSVALELAHHQWVVSRPIGGSPDAITSFTIGTRLHFESHDFAFRPALSYAHALGGTLEREDYHVLEVDLLFEIGSRGAAPRERLLE